MVKIVIELKRRNCSEKKVIVKQRQIFGGESKFLCQTKARQAVWPGCRQNRNRAKRS